MARGEMGCSTGGVGEAAQKEARCKRIGHVTVAHRLTHDATPARCHFSHLRCQSLAIYATYERMRVHTKGFVRRGQRRFD